VRVHVYNVLGAACKASIPTSGNGKFYTDISLLSIAWSTSFRSRSFFLEELGMKPHCFESTTSTATAPQRKCNNAKPIAYLVEVDVNACAKGRRADMTVEMRRSSSARRKSPTF
jgi:hypothetical protein